MPAKPPRLPKVPTIQEHIRAHWRFATILLSIGALSSCSWFPESTFYLSSQSRLPRWIALRGLSRSELNLRVDYIASPLKSYARITVTNTHGEVVKRLDSDMLGSEPLLADGTPARGNSPSYDIVVVNGTVDIFEQREANNTLYMCDDGVVWSKLAPGATMPPSVKPVS